MLATLTLPAAGTSRDALRALRVQVRSADELRRALREARERPLRLDASKLNCMLCADAERGLLEVQGAMTWTDLAAALGPEDGRLAAWTGSPGLPATVGEAVSLDAAAPDGAPVSACVESIALVTVDGELRRLCRDQPSRLFQLVVGGRGLFGLIYSVTLRIEALRLAAERAQPAVELELPGSQPSHGVACVVQTLLPPPRVEEFLQDARALAAEHRVLLRHLAVRRLWTGADCALVAAKREWASVTLRLQMPATLGACAHAAQVRRALIAMAIERGGSFPPAAACDASRAQLDACYPELPAFLAQKRRYDPAERLQDGWYRGVTALLRLQGCESRWQN